MIHILSSLPQEHPLEAHPATALVLHQNLVDTSQGPRAYASKSWVRAWCSSKVAMLQGRSKQVGCVLWKCFWVQHKSTVDMS